jgi:hypothetical protein
MTEQDAKSRAIKETDYCYVLACAWSGAANDSICLERIYVKGGCEEIRLAWWKDGKQANRPADIDQRCLNPVPRQWLLWCYFTA